MERTKRVLAKRGSENTFDVFFVPKRLIRYVQIPNEIDIKASLEKLFSELFINPHDF